MTKLMNAGVLALGFSLAVCMSQAAGEAPETVDELVDMLTSGDGWNVDSPHGYEIIGFDGYYEANPDWSVEAAFDGDLGNFAHSPDGGPLLWAGLDLGEGEAKRITGIRYAPREGYEERGVGATIYGANDFDPGAFDPTPNGDPNRGDAVPLMTIEEEQPGGEWTSFDIDHEGTFRYVFYEADPEVDDSLHIDLAGIEFYGASEDQEEGEWLEVTTEFAEEANQRMEAREHAHKFGPEAVAPVAALFDHENRDVYIAAKWSLRNIVHESARPREDEAEQEAAQQAMADALAELLEDDPSDRVAREALYLLGLCASEEHVPAIAEWLTEPTFVDEACDALLRIPGEAGLAAMLDAVEDAEGGVAVSLIHAIAMEEAPAARERLEELAESDDETIAEAAAHALS
ncbi:MAG: hypothetical protein ACLFV4_13545, partial [Candidatus Hydrogenedentota bacterium]